MLDSHDTLQDLLEILEIRHIPGDGQTGMTRVSLFRGRGGGGIGVSVLDVGRLGQDACPRGRLARLSRVRRRGRVEGVETLDILEPGERAVRGW